jgi:carnitine-CoA ligase
MSVYDGEWVVSSLIDDRAERIGDRLAVTAAGGQRTYAELRDEAQRVGRFLQRLGVGPGDPVATMLDTSLDYVAAWLGIVWAGGVDVPVNTEFKGLFLEHLLRDASARVLVIDARWVRRLDDLDLPDLTHVVVVGEPSGGTSRSVHRFADALADDPAPLVPRGPEDLVYVIYTSGTTGGSKGVMHTNRSALWYVQPFRMQLGWRDGDVVYCNFPFFHQMGRSSMTTTAFWEGASVALRPHFSAREFWDDVRELGATIFGYLGAILLLLDAQPERPDDADNPLRVGFGAAAPPTLMRRFEERFGVTLLENYGSTECGVPSFAMPGDVRHGTMGRPAWYMDVEIHDEHDRPVPAGELGEIVVRPREPGSIFQGYWNRPEATLEAFRNLWFHSGDQGRLTEDGYLVYTDRIKDSIRRRGENISSFEVERAMQAHPAVIECAAYAVPSELTEDEVMVSVVLKPDVPATPEELLGFAADRIPRFAVPRYLRVVGELPRTPSQRVQKFKLRDEGVTPDTADREALGITLVRD